MTSLRTTPLQNLSLRYVYRIFPMCHKESSATKYKNKQSNRERHKLLAYCPCVQVVIYPNDLTPVAQYFSSYGNQFDF